MYDDKSFDDEQSHEKNQMRNGEWIECGRCRAIMFDTFKSCWSCGISLTGRNKVPVKL